MERNRDQKYPARRYLCRPFPGRRLAAPRYQSKRDDGAVAPVDGRGLLRNPFDRDYTRHFWGRNVWKDDRT